MNRVPM